MSRLHLFCADREARGRVLAGQLAHAGVDLDTDPPRAALPQPCLLFFDEAGPPVFEALRLMGRGGLQRVLAVAATTDALVPETAWLLLQAGASDVFAWDHSGQPAREVAARLERWHAIDELIGSPLVQANLVGQSPAWIASLRQVVEVARFSDGPVLICGESGTGKELAAQLIHALDAREDKRELVVLDCTTVVPELSGSEFFGHERGSFTGAVAARDGAFALADRGTLFLDEVGELPLGLQAQLLRVVQERTYKRVGGNAWQQTAFRLVCATNQDLKDAVAGGRFRHDLYYRVASRVCRMPALRERPEDILLLMRRFLRDQRPEGGEPPDLDGPVREYLLTRDYPGNVRDLKQLVGRIAARHVGPGPITVGDLPPDELPVGHAAGGWPDPSFRSTIRRAVELGTSLEEIRRTAVNAAIEAAVEAEEGSLQRAARKLGVTDRALQIRRAQGRAPGAWPGR